MTWKNKLKPDCMVCNEEIESGKHCDRCYDVLTCDIAAQKPKLGVFCGVMVIVLIAFVVFISWP